MQHEFAIQAQAPTEQRAITSKVKAGPLGMDDIFLAKKPDVKRKVIDLNGLGGLGQRREDIHAETSEERRPPENIYSIACSTYRQVSFLNISQE